MNKCDPLTRAQCPHGAYCEPFVVYADSSECAKLNKATIRLPKSNADRIRNMSDEDLADFMNNFNICDTRANEECRFTFLANCTECVLDWLKQPAREAKS